MDKYDIQYLPFDININFYNSFGQDKNRVKINTFYEVQINLL